MTCSLKSITGGISFADFCHIIDNNDGHASERKGMRGVYDVYKERKGYVTKGDAALTASAIIAQDLEYS